MNFEIEVHPFLFFKGNNHLLCPECRKRGVPVRIKFKSRHKRVQCPRCHGYVTKERFKECMRPFEPQKTDF